MNLWRKAVGLLLGLALSLSAGAQVISDGDGLLFANTPQTSFQNALQTTLVPQRNYGSGTPTFTRASTAYQTDFEGKLNLLPSGAARMQGARVVRNLLTYTEALQNAAWVKLIGGTGSAPTATDAYAVAPDGTMTASRLQLNRGAGNTSSDYSILHQILTASTAIQNSVWLKSNTGASQNVLMGNSSGGYAAVTVTTTWQRFAVADTVGGQFELSSRGVYTTTNSVDMLVWHPQNEITVGQTNQNPSEYVSVGVLSAPYQGAGVDGIQYFNYLNGNTVASNVVTQAQGLPIVAGQSGVSASAPVDAKGPYGYLAEGARTNLFLQSQALATTSTSTNITAGNNDAGTTAPDGTTTATLLTATAGNGTTLQSITGTAASYTFSVWLKRKTGTGTVNITVNGGTTYVAAAVTTSWQQFTTTQTLTAAGYNSGIQIVTNGDAVWAWGAQTELGALASSYIPTTTVAVTRNIDVDQYVSSGNLAATMSGTIQVAPEQTFGTFTGYIFSTYVDSNNSTSVLFDGTNLIARKRIGGTNHDATIAWTPTANTVAKVGWRFDSVNGSDIWLNGTKGTNDSTTTAAQIGTNFQIGADGNGANADYCEHRLFQIYPVALPAWRLINLTTSSDATDWLSDPMWRMAANDPSYRLVANR